ncbi:MAG TPA: glycosyltransferase family 2 protein, partial [Alphaproteobacteria bacterium]|nr:glycosyltransferase family 2 protein [Alphaproteobacteria bacterium]
MKNRTPTVSIIIANYNFAKYIGDALESVHAQSFRDWECIVIDDGSTDDSAQIIKRFCRRDARFRLIQKNHGGVSAARNAGLDI